MMWGIMRHVLLLALTLSSLPQTALASRYFWLRSFESGSLSFWQNRYLPNTDNLCRNKLGLGSQLYWERCGMDPDNPGRILPGTKLNWERGTGPGSRVYWESAITVPEGMQPAQLCNAPGGYNSGMRLYYQYCTGPGSKVYWEQGTNRGSEIFWEAGLKRSIAPDWIGPCMDPSVSLDTNWCQALRDDVVLQDVSILDWQGLFSSQSQQASLEAEARSRSACPPSEGYNAQDLNTFTQSIVDILFNSYANQHIQPQIAPSDAGTPFSTTN
jgi:hypothetical protein